jgi:hypothetical protein
MELVGREAELASVDPAAQEARRTVVGGLPDALRERVTDGRHGGHA